MPNDDIVTRLREYSARGAVFATNDMCWEAADEIERLEAEVKRLDSLLIRQNAVMSSDDIVIDLRYCAEIHEGRSRHRCIADAADEIERLRAIAEFAAHSDGCEQPWHGIERVCTCGLMELWEARRG